MSHFNIDRRDIEFVLFEQLGIEKLLEKPEFADYSREIFEMVLAEGAKLATEKLAPINLEADQEGCRLEDGQVKVPKAFHEIYKLYTEGGWVAPSLNPEYGGQGLPMAIATAVLEMFIGACSSFVFYPGLTASAGHLLETFGDKALVERFVPNMYSGKWTGTMCLTEPDAGSAVGDLKSSAVKNDDGTYNIVGTKIFITAGDHDLAENIIHLVLARVKGDAPGVKGISLFAVPKYWVNEDGSLGERNDVTTGGIEHKMGIHAGSTCVLNFGDDNQCRGYLIGEQSRGIYAMFQMMNEARLVTGAQGMATGNAAYRAALAYAQERVQGTEIAEMRNVDAPRVTIDKHADVRRMLLTMKAYGEGLRALIYHAAVSIDWAKCAEDEDEAEEKEDKLSLLTPICKAYGSDIGFKMTELAMQTFGGYGYISEYQVEQYMRDVKIASIYEGTNGIQAMDLLGRKLPMKMGQVFMGYLQELNSFVDDNEDHEELGEAIEFLGETKNKLGEIAFKFAGMGMNDPEFPMLNAVPFLHMMGEITVAKLLLEQAIIASDKLEAGAIANDETFYKGKIATAKFFAFNILPNALATARAIEFEDRSALEIEFV